MEKIIEQLKTLQNVKPRKEWVQLQRELLLSQIKSQAAARKQSRILNTWFLVKSFMPTSVLRFAAKPLGALTVLAVFVFGTGMLGVNASKGSLPGDILYSVKRTSEKMQVGLTVSKEKEAALHVQFAEERVNEIEKVTQGQATSDKKMKQISISVEGLKDEMKQAQENLDQAKDQPRKAQAVVAMAKVLDVKSEEINNRIEQNKSQSGEQAIVDKLSEAQVATAKAGVKALEVIVEKHEQGEVTMSEGELVKTIDNKIEKAKETLKQAEQKVENAKILFESTQKATLEIEVESPASTNPSSLGEPAAAPTKVEVPTLSGDAVSVTPAEADGKPAEAKQILTEAKDLLNHGDLSSAMEKVKQSAEITTEMNEQAKMIVE